MADLYRLNCSAAARGGELASVSLYRISPNYLISNSITSTSMCLNPTTLLAYGTTRPWPQSIFLHQRRLLLENCAPTLRHCLDAHAAFAFRMRPLRLPQGTAYAPTAIVLRFPRPLPSSATSLCSPTCMHDAQAVVAGCVTLQHM